MEDILKMAALAVTGGVLLIFLREKTPAIGFCLSCLLVTLIAFGMLPKLEMVVESAKSLFFAEHPWASLLLRGVGIGYVTEMTANLLSGAGEESAAKAVIMAGNICLAVLALEPAAHVLRAAEALLS